METAAQHADQSRLRAALSGDELAFVQIVETYSPRLMAVAQRMVGSEGEAEDVVQEAFVRLWHHGRRLEIGDDGLAPWLHRVTRNLCLDRLRRRKDHSEAALEALAADDDQASALEEKDLARVMRSCIAELPPRQREAISLFHLEGCSQAELAERMELSIEAAESLLARGRRKLKGALQTVWEDYFNA